MPLNQEAVERYNKIRAKYENGATPEPERLTCAGLLQRMERDFPGIREVADVMDGRIPGGRTGTAPKRPYPYPKPTEDMVDLGVDIFARMTGLDPAQVRAAGRVAQTVAQTVKTAASVDAAVNSARVQAEYIHGRRLTITIEIPGHALGEFERAVDANPACVDAFVEGITDTVAREIRAKL